MDFASLLAAFGMGSVVTALVQAYLTHLSETKSRTFNERKAAYVGLLEAYHQAAVEGTDAAAKNYALWQMRCEIVAPKSVRDAVQAIVDTNEDLGARGDAHENLKSAMRVDLGVSS